MKLIIAIVQDEDSRRLIDHLMDQGFSATRLATTGGFLRSGNTTLLIGVEDARVDAAMAVIEQVCKSRTQTVAVPPPVGRDASAFLHAPAMEVRVGGATVFVLSVEDFRKL